METLTIHLQTRRREMAQRFSMAQHGVAALLLFIGGFAKIRAGESDELIIASLELLAGASVIISTFFEIRKSERHPHNSIKWLDIFAGVMLAVEGISKFHAGPKHYPIAFANFLAALATICVGIFHHRIIQTTRIRLDEAGVRARTSPVRTFHLSWDEIQSIAVDETAIRFLTARGERLIKLKKLTNGKDIRERFLAYLQAHHIEVNSLESGHTKQQDAPVKAL
jgi:hypothetical protein